MVILLTNKKYNGNITLNKQIHHVVSSGTTKSSAFVPSYYLGKWIFASRAMPAKANINRGGTHHETIKTGKT